MDYICIEIIGTGERRRIDRPIFVTVNRNGILATPHAVKALGVGDGEHIWSFGEPIGYPVVEKITLAEYLESLGEEETDPELRAEEALNILLGGSYETE